MNSIPLYEHIQGNFYVISSTKYRIGFREGVSE